MRFDGVLFLRAANALFGYGCKIFICFLLITCVGINVLPTEAASTNVSGTITTNTTWSKTNAPYIVTGDLTVSSGVTLTVQPGVDIKMNGNYSIFVKGILNAQGTAAERIRFTSNKATPAQGDWSAIYLDGPSNILRYVTIEYGNYGAFLSGSDSIFDQALIQNNAYGIYLGYNARLIVTNSEIRNNTAAGIRLSNVPVAPQITHNLITENQNGIIVSLSTSATDPAAIITNNQIYNNTVRNLALAGPSYRVLADASLNWWGSADPQQVMAGIDHQALSYSRAEINPILDGPQGNPVSFRIHFGGYDTNLLWDSPLQSHYIAGRMKIGPTALLRVLPGVKIYFINDAMFDIYGALDMQGTPQSRIELMSYSKIVPTSYWNGLYFYDSSDDNRSIITYCDFWNSYHALRTENASPTFRFNKIFSSYITFNLEGYNASDIRWNLIIEPIAQVMSLVNRNGGFPQPVFRDNSIFGSPQLLQLFSSSAAFAPLVINAENNWWGTADAVVIEDKMRHHPDDPVNPLVDYQPFRTAPNLLTNVVATQKFIDPGRGETTTISFNLAQESYVSIVLKDWLGNQKVVRTLIDNVRQAAGTRQVIWNGLNDQGQRLPDGVYTYEIITQSVASSVYDRYQPPYIKGSVDVLSTSSLSTAVIKPYEGQRLEVRYDLLEPAVVTILIGEPAAKFNQVATPVFRQPRKATGNVYIWDGRLKEGSLGKSNDHHVYVVTETLPVNGIAVLTETATDPIGVLKADPKAFNPMYGQKTKIYFTLTASAKTSVQIVSPDGVVLRTLIDQQILSAAEHNVDWDGKDSQGRLARDGRDYRIRVTALVGSQSVVKEGVVGIYR